VGESVVFIRNYSLNSSVVAYDSTAAWAILYFGLRHPGQFHPLHKISADVTFSPAPSLIGLYTEFFRSENNSSLGKAKSRWRRVGEPEPASSAEKDSEMLARASARSLRESFGTMGLWAPFLAFLCHETPCRKLVPKPILHLWQRLVKSQLFRQAWQPFEAIQSPLRNGLSLLR
jgi:hypothetical protein